MSLHLYFRYFLKLSVIISSLDSFGKAYSLHLTCSSVLCFFSHAFMGLVQVRVCYCIGRRFEEGNFCLFCFVLFRVVFLF